MARIDWDRLKRKYGKNVSGQKYRDMMKEIIAHNTEQIGKSIGRLTQDHYEKAMKKITKKEKKFIIPDVSEVLPQRAVYIRKGADQGKILMETMRDRLTKDLRGVMQLTTAKTKEPIYVKRRGKEAGAINPKIISEYERRITKTFEGYTKRDKKLKMPKNIHTIAVTETRSAINDIKYKYAVSLMEKNENVDVKKKWIHNRGLSRIPRLGHMEVASKAGIPLQALFDVPIYIDQGRLKGKLVRIEQMKSPHDPNASPENIISCNCDIQFYALKRS